VRCKVCRSSLVNIKERYCPECGRGFDPNDPTSFATAGTKQRGWIELLVVAAIAFLVGCAILYFENRSMSATNGSWDWVHIRKTLLQAAIIWPVLFGFLYAAYRCIFFVMRAWHR
jgi:hypothetical protein